MDKSGRSKGKIIIAAAAVIAVALAVLCGLYALRHLQTKKNGVELRAGRDYEPATVNIFLQNDPEWGGDYIGNSHTTLASAGCLISVVSSSLGSFGYDISPKELNAALTAANAFDGDYLLWNRIKDAVPGVDYKFSRLISSSRIDSDLEKGLLPIVKVKYKGSGVQHWLLVVGAKDGEYLVIDPLNSDRKAIPLSSHGRVYAYRVLVPAK